VVVVRSPIEPTKLLCKRLIGLPGDTLPMIDGSFITVPRGHIFVQGDNPQHSFDSRQFGPVPIALFYGRASAIVYPRLQQL
jgi:signal peptidase I